MKTKIYIIVLLLFSSNSFSQTPSIDSLKELISIADDTTKIGLFQKLAYNYTDDLDTAIYYLGESYSIALLYKNYPAVLSCIGDFQFIFYRRGMIDSAIYYLNKEIEIGEIVSDSLKSKINYGQVYVKLGVSYKQKSKFDKSVEYYTKAIKIFEEQHNLDGLASVNLNIGNIYFYYLNTDNYQKALEYYNEAETYGIDAQNAPIYLRAKLNRAQVYKERELYSEAIKINSEVIDFGQNNPNMKEDIADVLFEAHSMLGGLYIESKEYELAEEQLLIARKDYLKNFEEKGNMANIYGSLALLYNNWGKTSLAINYYKMAIDLYAELGFKKEIADNYKELSQLYAQQQNYRKSLDYFQSYADLKDSLFNADVSEQINEMQAKYESEKKQKEIELLTKDQEKQSIVNKAIMAVAALVVLIAFFVFRSYLMKKKANEKLEKQNKEILEQKEQIEEQKQEITDSIRYARRIQQAVLPPNELFDEYFDEYFILFRPRDIVSGDFYWATERDNKVYVAAADCTGHGVPGAFMSMLGISFLNEIVNKGEVKDAAGVLNKLRESVMDSLRQTGKANEAKDGMDIALCVIDKSTNIVEYAGAYNPLYIIRDGELIQHKADKMPIGIYFREPKPFNNNEVEVQKNDIIYIFSDGYVDQFGGKSGRKFMSKRFRELLLSVSTEPLQKQREILDVKLDLWMGDISQIDDIIVLGIKI